MMFFRSTGLGGLVLIGFLAWVFIASTPQERIVRVCSPINWSGTMFESALALTFTSYVETFALTFDRFEYGCQYSVWRLFYEKQYLDEMKEDESNLEGVEHED